MISIIYWIMNNFIVPNHKRENKNVQFWMHCFYCYAGKYYVETYTIASEHDDCLGKNRD